jgi:phosphatidylethanolamine-binding protein (PEBP) family uncharacterized protein
LVTLNKVNSTSKAVVALISGALLFGCASDGRTLREPSFDQTTTTRTVSTSAVNSEKGPSGFELTSSDFGPGAVAPAKATDCATAGYSYPNLEWKDVPAGTQELVLTLSNQTDYKKPQLLWLMAGISPNETRLESGVFPDGLATDQPAFETLNDWGTAGYPCINDLAKDGSMSQLQFRIYALKSKSGLQPSGHGNNSWAEVRAKASESAAIMMRYETQQ